MNTLALYTTIYPGVEKYIPRWSLSVCQQTDRDFDLWVGVDSIGIDRAIELLGEELRPKHLIPSEGKSPTEIRIAAIESLVSCYSEVVFVDCDDVLHPARIEAARGFLEAFDAVACALQVIDESGRELGITFGLDRGEDLASLLPRYNVFGLSNTAYRSEVLKHCLPSSPETEIIDWHLATIAFVRGARLGFDSTARMAYRQYSQNIANILPPFTSEQVLAATSRVLGHYRCLLERADEFPANHRKAWTAARERAECFQQQVSRSHVLSKYVRALNRITPRYIWWWCVAHPELEDIWRN